MMTLARILIFMIYMDQGHDVTAGTDKLEYFA